MTDQTASRLMLAETVDRLFRGIAGRLSEHDDDAAGRGELSDALWAMVEDNGITAVFVPEQAGGFGGSWEDAGVVLRAAGYFGVPLPIAETLLAQGLLAKAGIVPPAGPLAIAIADSTMLRAEPGGSSRISGVVQAVPWANAAKHLLVACGPRVALVPASAVTVVPRPPTVAREPVADVHFDNVMAVHTGEIAQDVFALAALSRAAQIAGALDAALHLSVAYANERVQFGKPIGKFQAIQQSLALLAAEAAAVGCATLAACRRLDGHDAGFETAAAKWRANRAVGVATSIAHQVHGAIGFTREHALHRVTQRLWSWRSEYGNDQYWATRLGAMAARMGPEDFWSELTARGDEAGSR